MTEVAMLPTTFFGTDLPKIGVGSDRLLVNTGLLAIRMDQPWSNRVTFQFKDRLVATENQNGDGVTYDAEIEPEDWRFSRWCNENGLRIAATTEVELVHVGSIPYANYGTWGKLKTDEGNAEDVIRQLHRVPVDSLPRVPERSVQLGTA